MTTTTRRAPRRITLGEAYATHCRLIAGLLKGGGTMPPDAAQIHAQQLEAIAVHLDGPADEEPGPALPLLGGASRQVHADPG